MNNDAAQTDVETTAMQMKVAAETRRLANLEGKKKRGPVERSPAESGQERHRGRPRGSRNKRTIVATIGRGGAAAAIRREIRDHERKLRALLKALAVIGE